MNKSVLVKITVLLLCVTFLTGCGGIQTAIKKRNLDVQTNMSETIFLDPVSPAKKTVFLQLKNTSDKDLDFSLPMKSAFLAKGYAVVEDPEKAHFWVQANVLKIGKSDLREREMLLSGSYGSAIAGAYTLSRFGSGNGRVVTGVIGAGLGFIGDALVEDTFFLMVTDVQISERAKEGVIVTEKNTANLVQGSSGYKTVSSSETVERKKFQTRIISSANKMNLEFEEAQPVLMDGLVKSVSGLF